MELGVENNEGQDPAEDAAVSEVRRRNKRTKTPIACVPCRMTKTRCVLVQGHESCEACLKKSRTCVQPGPAKPRTKSSQKISELESKIASLSSALSARQPQDHQQLGESSVSGTPTQSVSSERSRDFSLSFRRPTWEHLHESQSKQHYSAPPADLDVVDRGLLDVPTAEVLLDHWNTSMRPILPIVALSGKNLHECRRTKPMLFLAILSVASASILPSFQSPLVKELKHQLAKQILEQGRRCLDLVQACLLYSQYYTHDPDSPHALPTQFVSAAITMLCDLGVVEHITVASGPNKDEAREVARAYLACCNATLFRQQNLMPPSSRLEACINVLLTALPVTPSDALLCSLVRLQVILDNVSNTFDSGDKKADGDFDSPTVQYQLRTFQERLRSWEASTPEFVDDRLKRCLVQFANMCLHQTAVRCYMHKSFACDAAGNFHASDVTLSSQHVSSICSCIDSSQTLLDAYLSLDSRLARALPNHYLMWTLYAAVALIKITPFREAMRDRTPAAHPEEASAVSHLDAMLSKISEITQDGYLPQARTWGMAFAKLRLWYLHKKQVCISSSGRCDAGSDDGPVYSVFGNGNERQSPTEVPGVVHGGSAPPSLLSIQSLTENGTTPDQSSRQATSIGPYGPPAAAAAAGVFGAGPLQSPTSTPGGRPRQPFDATTASAEAAYDPFSYAGTNWDDLFLDTNSFREFESLLMDDSDSWLKMLI
ncbi:hypothetical protein AYL99_02640 [Fonsecaea erecta]|uniref:Zn(2)-C6 fungal-type domain-containing protein n=1 Tax=Fonsecaea erecta TaxID=1367422 RepID=A0A178ZVY6_9EURO|nr:hypothetical protein AYL99_02640 [Fonsecaea erecta]OAP63413.1 hypothetical protein AYL99_02640 [Fonsecaea erecta]